MATTASQASPRSIFVTVVAWIFIVLSGLASLIGILQNIMIFTAFTHPPASESADFFVRYPQIFFLGFLLINLFTLTTSIGLLRRKKWARPAFIGIMSLGIAWMLFSSALQWVLLADVPGDSSISTMLTVIKATTLVFAVGLSVLFGWIIKRLRSQNVKAEFRAPVIPSSSAPRPWIVE